MVVYRETKTADSNALQRHQDVQSMFQLLRLRSVSGGWADASSLRAIAFLAKYNNKDETNPRKKIARPTMSKLLNELSMSSIDEGCSCSQVIHFCSLHKIVYYILDFRYKLFESNNHMKYRTDLPRLVFMCAIGHMYRRP